MFWYQFLVCAVLVYALSIYDLIWSGREKIYNLHQTKLAWSMGRVPLLVKMRGITCIRVPTWKCGIQCKIDNVEEVILNLYNSQNLEYLQWSEGEYWICSTRRNVLNTYNIRRSISRRGCSCICSSIVASQDSSNHIPEKSSILKFNWLLKM